jgi:predicted AlkP superfamily phosphohydrolase/phosphomutase
VTSGCRAAFLCLSFAAVVSGACSADRPPVGKRVIVLGFDGMDYGLTHRLLSEGRLPNFERLAETGGFHALRTSVPPQSPVAWSNVITGLDAGGHGIYDFLHRDSLTLMPYLSTSRTEPVGRTVRLGRWQLPLSGGAVELLRHGTPFWEVLEEHGVATTVIRIPANFPPSGAASRELSGMGTPDIVGSSGMFSFFTTAPERITGKVTGGTVNAVELDDQVVHGTLKGPPNPFLRSGDTVAVDFTVYVDASQPVAKVVVGDQEVLLREGEWSEWLDVEFRLLGALQSLRGMCRMYLRQVHPEFELYVTPINLDPLKPAMPISTPSGFAAKLARATGRFYTQEMPEETKALRAGVFDDADFMQQVSMVVEEERRLYAYVLDGFHDGFLFYYFGNIDQISHMMWRAMDATHPAHDSVADAPYRHVIEDLYVRADSVVGATLDQLGDEATIIVMSDHGFAPWTRSFNVNTWLYENGYLALQDPARRGEMEYFQNVDWSRTRAYALGLSSLYINVRGREAVGSVPRGQRDLILDEIARGLLRYIDPETGARAIANVYQREEVYQDSGYRDVGPDLIIGFARGVRGSDESALGQLSADVMVDNTSKWSGDHMADPEIVPGILLSNRSLQRHANSLTVLAAAVLAAFGIEGFPPRY